MLRIHKEQITFSILNVQKVSHNERGTHSIDDKKTCLLFSTAWVSAGISLPSFLCDQTDQSPLFMFMDETVLNHTGNVSVEVLKTCRCCLRPVIDA